jgi:hypothetical protein
MREPMLIFDCPKYWSYLLGSNSYPMNNRQTLKQPQLQLLLYRAENPTMFTPRQFFRKIKLMSLNTSFPLFAHTFIFGLSAAFTPDIPL